MSYPKELSENFTFMALETIRQVEDTLRIIESPGNELIGKIVARDDYIDILKNVIENKCFMHINQLKELDEQEINKVRFIAVISNNLEHIADYAVNIVLQRKHFSDRLFMRRYDYRSFFEKILEAMDLIVQSLEDGDMSMALSLCKSESEIDALFKQVFGRIMEELKKGDQTGDLVTALFVFRYLERMGDALLNIGEAIISSIVGEKLKIENYRAIEKTLDAADFQAENAPFTYRNIAETQSGCNVGLVGGIETGRSAKGMIFKEGKAEKILAEKNKIEIWNRVHPGLTPRVFGMQENGKNASMVIEYVSGRTLQEILLAGNDDQLGTALTAILHTMGELWLRTKVMEPVRAHFFDQMVDRIADVFRVHPEFDRGAISIGEIEIHSFREYIEELKEIEAGMQAPFSVLIHGDFNNDNVIYDQDRDRVYLIDIYRSCYSDYVQDVSVFLVSNFRIPVFDIPLRRRIDNVAMESLRAFRAFALENNDRHFEARLALGLARSLITSTRFELNKEFTRSMFQRAWYLLEKIHDLDGKDPAGFKLPVEVLVY